MKSEFRAAAPANDTAVEDKVNDEMRKYEAIVLSSRVDPEKYMNGGLFDMCAFYNDHQHVLPIHMAVYRGCVGSKKGASACVESVFSGVKRLLGDFAQRMGPELLELYVFIHYNWQYEFMQPTIEEIVAAYLKLHGPEPLEEDVADGEDEDEDEDEAEGAPAAAPTAAPAAAVASSDS